MEMEILGRLIKFALLAVLVAILVFGAWQLLAFRAVRGKLQEIRQKLHDDGVLTLRKDGQPRRVKRPNKNALQGEEWAQAIESYRQRLAQAVAAYADAEVLVSKRILHGFIAFFCITLIASTSLLFAAELLFAPALELARSSSVVVSSFLSQLPKQLDVVQASPQTHAGFVGQVALLIHSKIVAVLLASIPIFGWQRITAPKLFDDSIAEARAELATIEKDPGAARDALLRSGYIGNPIFAAFRKLAHSFSRQSVPNNKI